jgi:hypothetical protein
VAKCKGGVTLVFRRNPTGVAAEGEGKARPRTLLSQGLAARGAVGFGRGVTILPAFRASLQEFWQGAHR